MFNGFEKKKSLVLFLGFGVFFFCFFNVRVLAVEPVYPWSGSGLTVAWENSKDNDLYFCNGEICWIWDVAGGFWEGGGEAFELSEDWTGVKPLGGVYPWSGNGLTAAWTNPKDNDLYFCNGEICWIWDAMGSFWENSGNPFKMSASWANTGAAGFYFLEKVLFTQAEGEIMNPERGFHRANVSLFPLGQYRLSNESNPESEVIFYPTGDLKWVREEGQTLIQAYVYLNDFKDRVLTAEFLTQLNDGLGKVREAGIKVNLVFAYNAGPLTATDASLERIKGHLGQLKPVLEVNKDVILSFKAGFIGAWGEWHDSTNGLVTPGNKREVLAAVLANFPAERMVYLRYPADRQEIFRATELSENTAFSGSSLARVGFHNDCFLSDWTDGGTYLEGKNDPLRGYVARESRFVPMGGETCGLPAEAARYSCSQVLAELAQAHWTHLAWDFYKPILDKLRQNGCWEEIEERLGYRFVLKSWATQPNVGQGEELRFRAVIKNGGFAAMFNERPVFLVLKNKLTGQRYDFQLAGFDARRWGAGEEMVLRGKVALPADMGEGEYEVFLWLPDAAVRLRERPVYSVRLANEGIWEESLGANRVFDRLIISGGGGCVFCQTGVPGKNQGNANCDNRVNGLDFAWWEMIKRKATAAEVEKRGVNFSCSAASSALVLDQEDFLIWGRNYGE